MSPPAGHLLRRLGRDGPKIEAVGFGMMGMSVGYGPAASDEERFKLLDRAWEIGCTNWDTADIYGDSEDVIGKWVKLHPERRKDIFLASKFGLKGTADGIVIDSSPEYCKASIERSLQRLEVDYIDLYYVHRPNPDVPIEKTVQVMKEFVNDGKVKYLGLSEVSSSTLRRASAVHPIHAVQVEYNPWTLDIEGSSGTFLRDTCKELGVSIFAYSPLGRGIMTGRYRSSADFGPGDARAGMTRFQGDNFKKNLELVDRFAEVAARKGCTPSQVVLAWLLAQGDDVFVIPGTKNMKYLEENFGASVVEVTEEEERELRRLVSEAGVGGGRDPTFGAYVDTVPLEG
ncbi:alcohol dehydrogenase [Pleurostoma richardsiae]|uniref:Alcohol dehydrogenase n=1 Tax=Pleurostoma richardsiae TaxID=41990 RepID=A0AA38RK69_9PEZI|nr:alcohol dehydrogenase [Pleurostoma richardsiae]